MNLPPITAELIDKRRRVVWRFRSRQPVTDAEMQTAIKVYLNERGEPEPDKAIDVLMTPPQG